jgi:hypothetical protein
MEIVNPDKLYNENAIIKPPQFKPENIQKRYFKYIIDSRDRNTILFPNPNKYNLKLDEPMKDVISVELLVKDFPFNRPLIHSNNNILHTSAGDYTITNGNYTGTELASELQTQSGLTVTYNSITDKLTFTNSTGSAVTLKFLGNSVKYDEDNNVNKYLSNSIGKVIGFDIQDYTINNGYSLEAPYIVDLRNDNYIVMYMEKAKNIYSQNINANQSFAIINKHNDSLNGYLHNETIKKNFNPPIPSLSTLSFKFNDYDGNLYDFQNQNHRMELLFVCFAQQRCYNDIYKY